jgi:hypothetical protein
LFSASPLTTWPRPGIRPAAEFLLLAELVALVVIECRQLFEPVHEKVTKIESQMEDVRGVLTGANFSDMRATLGQLRERIDATGQVALCASPPQVLRAITQVASEALAHGRADTRVVCNCGLIAQEVSSSSKAR